MKWFWDWVWNKLEISKTIRDWIDQSKDELRNELADSSDIRHLERRINSLELEIEDLRDRIND